MAKKSKLKKYQQGGTDPVQPIQKDPNIQGPVGFLNSYFESPTFKQRLTSLNTEPTAYMNAMGTFWAGQRAMNPKVIETQGGSGSRAIGSENIVNTNRRSEDGPSIWLDRTQAKTLGTDLLNDIYPHEQTHNLRVLSNADELQFASANKDPEVKRLFDYSQGGRDLKTPNSFSKWVSSTQEGAPGHDNQPKENYADLNSLRYMMYKQGIYDTRKGPMTIDHMKKAMQNPWLNKQFTFKRMLQTFKPEDIVRLNNTVASNSPQGGDNTIGKNGLTVDPKYFTYENLPCIGCKDGLMAEYGMPMDPGPRIPGLGKSLMQSLPNMPPLSDGMHPIPGRMPMAGDPGQGGDTSKVVPGQFINAEQYKQSPPRDPSKKNWMDTAAGPLGLAAMIGYNNFLESGDRNWHPVQPQMAYNPNPYGQGSQAIMQDGGNISPFGNYALQPSTPKAPATMKVGDRNVDVDTARQIITQAKKNKIDPYEALAIAYQESGIEGNNRAYHLNPNEYGSPFGGAELGIKSIIAQDQYARSLQKKGVIPQGDAYRLQGYNGYGTIKKGHADLEGSGSIYGIPIPEEGINMKKNPLYGKRIIDIMNNTLKKNPQLKDMIDKGDYGYVMGEDENNSPSAKNGATMKKAKDGNWIQKAVNPAHKGYCTPMTKSTCTPRRKALAKTFKKHHGFHKGANGGDINDAMSMLTADMDQGGFIQPGWDQYDFGGIITDNMSPFNPHKYEQGGNVNGGAKLEEVGATYPNTDLLEQWLLYEEGGQVKPKSPPIYTSNLNDKRLRLYRDSDRYLQPTMVKDSENRGVIGKNSQKGHIYNTARARDMWTDENGVRREPMGIIGDNYYSAEIPEPAYNPMNLSQPTNYSLTYPQGSGQQSTYFPNQGALDSFTNNYPNLLISSQQAQGRGSVAFKNRPMENGGNVNGGAKIKEVDAKYPNTDLLEQWLLYANGGNVNGGAKVRDVNAVFPNTDLMEQWLLYENGGSLSSDKAKEMLRDGTANGKKLTAKQKRYFGMVASGKAAAGKSMSEDPTKPISGQEKYYQSSARLSYYKDLLNQKLKAKNPKAFGDYFKGLVDLRRTGNSQGAEKYVQDSKYNDYLSPQEVQSSLGERYQDYLNSISDVNSYNVAQGKQPLYGTIEGQNDLNNLNYGRRFASLQITPSVTIHNQAKNTNYSRAYNYDPKTNQVDYTETGDQKLRPDYLSPRDTPTVRFKQGGVMYDDGGDVQTMWGGNADLESYNPYDGGTIEFNGASHDNGGIGMAYNGNPIEVEGGEYASRDKGGNLHIYGNMYVPGTKTKFKAAAGAIADKEKRYDFLKTKGSDLVNNSNPANKFEQLAFNSGKVMMQGGEMGQKDLASKKEKLASLQKSMLEMAAEHGLDPFEMSKGKMKKAKGGASIPFFQDGGSDPGGNDPTRADRNMNPGNIKYGDFAKKYGAKRDKDGFAIFPTREKGQQAMKDLLTGKNYGNMSVSQAINKWTGGHPYRYDLGPITDKPVKDLNKDELDIVMSTMAQGEGTRYGMTPRPVPKPGPTSPAPKIPNPAPYTPYGLPDIPIDSAVPYSKPVNPAAPYDQLNVPADKNLPSNVEPLRLHNIAGELYGLATNRVEPVPAQRYEPQLFTPYQISLQDRLNANQSVFNAQMRSVGASNPAALGMLGAQKYAADQQVYGDEFRTNQAIAQDVTNKNIALVNDANMKNLGIADTQMVRQSQARSKTRELNQMILNSISDKYAKNDLNNKRLAAYENLYDYRFVPTEDGGQKATYFGPNAQFNYQGRVAPSNTKDVRTISRYDAQGNLKGYAEYEDSDLKEQQRLLDIEMKKRKLPLMPTPSLD